MFAAYRTKVSLPEPERPMTSIKFFFIEMYAMQKLTHI